MSWLLNKFKQFNTKIAIIYDNKEYSYKELYDEILHIKSFVLQEVKSGEVVGILSDYSFQSIALFFALYENKNIIVPIVSNLNAEIEQKLTESYADRLVKIANYNYELENLKSLTKPKILLELINTNNSGLILFSSGSTGKPKAMLHNLDNLINSYHDKKPKVLNIILFLMFDHIGGLNTLFNGISTGATMIVAKNRNVDTVCQVLQNYKIKVLPASPTFLNLMLINDSSVKYNLSDLRLITYGTEAMPESLLMSLKKSFPKTKFLQTFGTSETGISNTISKASDSTFMKIDEEKTEYKIVKNELWLRSKTQILGYLNYSTNNFSEDGWFKTGDIVETTEDGFLKIIGRSKEIINVGGLKVLPIEVENIILELDFIEDVLVFAEKNAITNQSVVCEIVLKTQVESAKQKILNHCKNNLERYKIPTKIKFIEKLDISERFKKKRIKQ